MFKQLEISNSSIKKTFVNLRQCLSILTILLITGCANLPSKQHWPENMPSREIFAEAHAQQVLAGTNKSKLESHLIWIKRFYQGSILYPLGWNRMTERLLNSLDESVDRQRVEKRMHDLGLKISIEWAQENNSRKIDSAAVATWGNALRTAVDLGEQESLISEVERDVDDLLNEKLLASQIDRERYYPPEDYDDF